MVIFSYYVFIILYTFLFGMLFKLDFTMYDDPFFYILGLLSLFLSVVLSALTQLFLLWILGRIRFGSREDSAFNHRFARDILKYAQYMLRIKVIVTGKDKIPDHNFVLMGNHQQNVDIIILRPIFKQQLNFIAKEVLFKAKIIGRWITLLGNIPISPYADRSAAESIVKAIRRVKKGYSMVIFPEGKRSFGNDMIDFKPGAFKLAMKSKTDILVCTLYDVAKVQMRPTLRKQKVYVHFNGVIKYDDFKDLKTNELSIKVKEIIQKQLDIFKEELN